MHYVPESSRDFLTGGISETAPNPSSIHEESAPLYLLAGLVGVLILVDVIAGLTGAFSTTFMGTRWVLWAALLGGARILYHTLEELSDGRVTAGLALTIAFAAAVWLSELYTAALVVFITLTGECVERFTIDRAQAAIRGAFDLSPPTARLLRDDEEIVCPLAELQIGDRVVIRPGERIPGDGIIETGETHVDESPLTGESLPVEKQPGSLVFAGTLNQFGGIVATVNKVGEETLLGQVTRTVAQAGQNPSQGERLADRLAKLFLPVILLAAAITFFGWWLSTGDWRAGTNPALGILVVACPCALVLATPTAVMATFAWLAKRGVVVKGSDALEQLANANVFAFDKTGTLTQGEPTLGTVQILSPEIDSDRVIFLAAIAEQHSEHPLAVPIHRFASESVWSLPIPDTSTATPGGGVVAEISGATLQQSISQLFPDWSPLGREQHVIRVGRLAWLRECGVSTAVEWDAIEGEFDQRVETPLFVSWNEEIVGVIGVTDQLRNSVGEALSELKRNGIERIVLLTGDREAAAKSVVGSLPAIDDAAWNLRPDEKAAWIATAQNSGQRVAMVGDGINDASALAKSDVGIAVARANHHLAAEAGRIVLLSEPLKTLPGLVQLSQKLIENIRQSILWFAIGLNGLGVIACAFGFLGPVEAAILHELGSLAVMLNAMRLLWYREESAESQSKIESRMENIAAWLSPARWAHLLIGHWAALVRVLAACGVLAWLVSNVVFLTHDETALVTRFGKHHAELNAGWHWRWPAPFETVQRERLKHLRVMEFGFRSLQTDTNRKPPTVIDWTSPHETTGIEPIPEEALLLTADQVPVEVAVEVHYQIADFSQFAFGNAAPEASLRRVTGDVLRTLAARTSLTNFLTIHRRELEQMCRKELEAHTQPLCLGVTIADVRMIEVHPPRHVVPAYREIADAFEEKEQRINEAQAYAARTLLETVGVEAFRVLGLSQDVSRRQDNAEDRPLDERLWRELMAIDDAAEPQKPSLSGNTADVIWEAKGSGIHRQETVGGEAHRLRKLADVYREHPQLTVTEWYWQVMEDILSTRDLTILDPKAGRPRMILGGGQPALLPGPPSAPQEPEPLPDR